MTSYNGHARSNYVRFDPERLRALQGLFDIRLDERENGLTAIISADEYGTPVAQIESPMDDRDRAYIATLGLDPDEVDEDSIDFLDVVHCAFADDMDGLFTWQEAGWEGDRYLCGLAFAIDRQGNIVKRISIGENDKVEGVKTPCRNPLPSEE